MDLFLAAQGNRSVLVTILSLFCFYFLVLEVILEGTFGRRI